MPNIKQLKEKTQRLAILDGSLYSAMFGVGTRFITPFALALGATPFMIGILSALSTLAATVGQYAGAWLLQFEKKRRNLLVRAVTMQSLMWIPIALIPLIPLDQVMLLIIFYTVFRFFGSAASPAWTSLIRDATFKKTRGVYFGKRNRIANLVDFVSSIIAGSFLSWLTGNPFLGFGVVFFAAFMFRFISSRVLAQHWDAPFKPIRESILKTIQLPKDKFFRNLLSLSTGMVFASGIAGPFFAIFMLRELHFSYFEFSIAVAAEIIAILVTQPYWGRVIDKYGTRPILFATAVLIPFIPISWVLADSLLYVVLIQVFGGIMWAGFDLARFTLLLKIAPRKKMPDYAAHSNGLNLMSSAFGIAVGSGLALFVEGMQIGLIGGLQIIFLVSGIARFLVTAISMPSISKHMSIDGPKFLMRVITVYPVKGILAEAAEIHHMLDDARQHFR